MQDVWGGGGNGGHKHTHSAATIRPPTRQLLMLSWPSEPDEYQEFLLLLAVPAPGWWPTFQVCVELVART